MVDNPLSFDGFPLNDSSTSPSDENEDFLAYIPKPELVFGLVGPIGTDLATVSEIFRKTLSDVGYQSFEIKITSLLEEFEYDFQLRNEPIESRYDSYIKASNKFRQLVDRQDIFALLSVGAIRN
jgi:cytidine deaminase